MCLSEGDVEKPAIVSQNAVNLASLSDSWSWSRTRLRLDFWTDLLHVSACVVFDLVRGAPWAAVYHGVQGPFVKGNVNGAVGKVDHIADIGLGPFYTLDLRVSI